MTKISFDRQALSGRAWALIAVCTIVLTLPAAANEDATALAEATPTRILAVVSGGFWETEVKDEQLEQTAEENGEEQQTSDNSEAEPALQKRRGYYRSVAIRSADNTSRLFLQRIWLSDNGPVLVDSQEIGALTDMRAYITDMRPENSTGIAKQQGFVTFVYLKDDPRSEEPDTWELYVDPFGDTAFTPASN
ncbi:MAG: hypothetical protein AAF724_15575 [Pseudomonadota bacterium]